MTAADLELVLSWRNHPDVRRYMFSTREIRREEHVTWFQKAASEAGRYLLLFELNGTPQGFLNIHQVAEGGVADWGFYVAPAAPKGVGTTMGRAALLFAFEQAKLSRLCGNVLAYNERSLRFHLKLGFSQEGVLRQHHFDGTQYHDVVCFGLLAKDYFTHN